jgi:hypothetical protein
MVFHAETFIVTIGLNQILILNASIFFIYRRLSIFNYLFYNALFA